jgi:DNA-binding PucR family transcriptional regulator
MNTSANINRDILSNYLIEAIEDKELLLTIEAFLQSNLNASSTAKRLFIHRNSLQYRLEKLLEKTGMDIRTFSNATFIFLATMLVRKEN